MTLETTDNRSGALTQILRYDILLSSASERLDNRSMLSIVGPEVTGSDREGSEGRPEDGADGGNTPLCCLTTELLVTNERAWCSQAARRGATP